MQQHSTRLRALRAVIAIAAIGFMRTPGGLAQPQTATIAQQVFDVASVKLFKPGSAPENRSIAASHGSLMMRQQTLRECIEWAYGLNDGAEIAGPGALDSEQYDIAAKAAGSATQDQLRLMLQGLLTERFKLSLHKKTEQRLAYLLVVGKSGPKLHEVQQEPVKGAHMAFDNGFMTIQMVNNVSGLVGFLGHFLDGPVEDRTGLTGVYEFKLKVEMDDPQAPPPQPGQAFSGFGLTRGLFAAVEELGLKLVSQKQPVDTLVIDHVERPSAN